MRYCLFGGERFYPTGGFGDYVKSADTVEALVQHVDENHTTEEKGDLFIEWNWGHIVDTETMKEVISFECTEYKTNEIILTWEEPEDG